MADFFGGPLLADIPVRGLRAVPLDIGGMRMPRFLQRAGLNGALGLRYQRANGDSYADAVQVQNCTS